MKESQGTRGGRITALVAVAVASLVAFASLGGVGFAQTAVGLGQYQDGKKVTICHKGKRTIRISVHAWPAHKRHGDTEGACANFAKHGQKHERSEHAKSGHGKKSEHARGAATPKSERSNGKSHGKGHS